MAIRNGYVRAWVFSPHRVPSFALIAADTICA